MGVERTDYIVYGYKLPYEIRNSNGDEIDFYEDYENEKENKFLPLIEGHEGEEFTIVSDGMSAEYNVFGLLIKQSDYDGWGFIELNFGNFDSEKVKSKYKELFECEIKEEPKLIIFSHFH